MPSARSPHETEDRLNPNIHSTTSNQPSAPNPSTRTRLRVRSGRDTRQGRSATMFLAQIFRLGFGIVFWVTIIFGWQTPIAPIANAAPLTCRLYDDHDVCIDRIKRSAKNYWEYRVSLTIDGQKQPEDVLDCRHYQRIDRDGFIDPFKPNDVGRFVCRYFNHRDWR